MLFFSFVTLFVSLTTATPLESKPTKHPSLDTLNRFANQVGSLAEEISRWNGNPNGVDSIVRHSREAINTLRAATSQVASGDSIDYWTVMTGFGPAGMSINTKTHALASSLQTKNALFKAINSQQVIYSLLDDAYSESTAFYETTGKKMPPGVYALMKPAHTELLGTLAVARESFRPSQGVVVIVENNIPGAPAFTYTLPPGASIPTSRPQIQPYPYQQQPQYGQGGQYPQYNPQLGQNQGPYNPQYPQSPYQTQYRQ